MRTLPRWIALLTALVVVALQVKVATAEDAFYDVAIGDLKLTSGQLPKPEDHAGVRPFTRRRVAMHPQVVAEGSGEAYVKVADNDVWRLRSGEWPDWPTSHVVIRTGAARDVSGQLILPSADGKEMQRIGFKIAAADAKEAAREPFYDARAMHYQWLAQLPIPGTAWFRHEATLAERKLKEANPKRGSTNPALFNQTGRSVADAYELFSGGRAISESLQLDRVLRDPAQKTEPTVEISTLEGITTAAIDWKPLLKDSHPKLDALSQRIPFDQHALFFASFGDVIKLSDQIKSDGRLLTNLAVAQSENAHVVERYERQLGIGLGSLARTLGPASIKSVAVTGSDPYFATGTDIAVLLETDHPDLLAAALHAQIAASAAKIPGVKIDKGEASGTKYEVVRSPDRTISSYVAEVGDKAIVITNSLAQLQQIAKVGHGVDGISTLDEYKFFRTRYPLGEQGESALLFLSDATIRRWCSAKWRIASARRVVTAAALADLTADHADGLAKGTVKDESLHTDVALIDAGELKLTNAGVSSSTQGSLEWMTPIIEMPIEKVTQSEADAYKVWRDGYQSNWRWAFDPIALRIGLLKDRLTSDLTIMPLIVGSEYNHFIAISRGAKIGLDSGDRHNALAEIALAINVNSEPMKEWGNMAASFVPQAHIEPFSWLGSSIYVYLDDDPFWKELSEVPPDKLEEFQRRSGSRVPFAFHAEVASPLKLTAFLAALRAFIEQTAPGMTAWESLEYNGQPYVRVKPTEQSRHGLGDDPNLALYYAPSASGLTVSLNEAVLKRAMDRQAGRTSNSKEPSTGTSGDEKKAAEKSADALPWLGDNLCFQVDRKLFDLLGNAAIDFPEGPDPLSDTKIQIRSWSNLPILNEWKRLFPDEDPVKVHERLWHITLACPGGGKYVWNNEWQTMESTVYGHPGQPKSNPKAPPLFARFQSANFGLTFEEQGLRARLELVRKKDE